jgi:hypothetical protein
LGDEHDDKFKGLIFDKNDKYYVVIFEKTLLICSLDKGHEGSLVKKYVLNTHIYEKICDVNIVSDEPDPDKGHHHQDKGHTQHYSKEISHNH